MRIVRGIACPRCPRRPPGGHPVLPGDLRREPAPGRAVVAGDRTVAAAAGVGPRPDRDRRDRRLAGVGALAASVVAEVVNALPGRRVQLRLPGLGLGQKFAAILVIAVVTMIAAPHGQPTAFAEPADTAPVPAATVSAPQTPLTSAPTAVTAPADNPDRASHAPRADDEEIRREESAHPRGGARGVAVEPC